MGAQEDPLKTAAFIFAGFSMMLNIRLCYSSAPYALIRFKLPEDLFSIFVRRMSSSLELWCLPSIVIGNIMDQLRIRSGVDKESIITWPSILCMWIDFLTYVILLIVYLMGGEQGHLTAHYWIIAFSGFNFGIEMVLVYAQDDDGTITWYMVGENSFPLFTSVVHYLTTLMFGNRRKWNSDYIVVFVDIIAAIMISFTAALIWTIKFKPTGGSGTKCNRLTLNPTGNQLSYSSDEVACTNYPTAADGHNHKGGFPTHTHYSAKNAGSCRYDSNRWHNFSPVLMIIVGMGLVYMIYPAIAPGMIVPFYLVDRIDMILLIATAVPPVIVALLKKHDLGPFVWLGNWGGSHNPFGTATESDPITQATINLTQLESSHTLTLKDSGTVVQEVTLDVSGQTASINQIKDQTSANINLKLKLAEVTITLNGTSNTLKANGSITTTKKVTPISGGTVETALKKDHDLLFTGSGLKKEGLGLGSVIIGPGTTDKKELNLNDTDLNANNNGKPTNLNLELKPGTKSKSTGSGTEPNESLTLSGTNTRLDLSGGITGTLTFNSGTLTASSITNVKYNLNDFHYTSTNEKSTNYQNYCCIGGKLMTWQSGKSGMPTWHLCDVFVILMIILAIIFVYSLHYRDSAISRAIINQPKMSTALSIIFYMCHEISLAVGFPGIASDEDVILPIQLVGAFLMVLLAPYSEGYLIEYKRHDPQHWPTEGMTPWNFLFVSYYLSSI
ncbi:Tpr-related protein family member, putative [Theileria annulata]|uniref:Tpr-related protein family member, putative n=1 Tax=Theileria annulata TaxID=5874 RepID=Q4UC59_THEAN|nr:Tpr-related protein family member, putative [Theileria annulata]CAI75592.1 Tpr-related protein family member, putative [Theileria annulata]|eukprot:XP_955068.1 Tpr-related protein family member, putative [Theileria annulata]